MLGSRPGLVLALHLALAPLAQAAPIPGLFNTGVDGLGAPLADGAVDPHYSLVVSADPLYPGPAAIVANPIAAGYWYANNSTSKWIAPALAQGYPSGGTPHPEGTYIYRLSFDLAGLDPATASVSGAFGADNGVTIQLNGAATGVPSAGYNPLRPFTLVSGFVAGVNTLDFVVANASAGGGINPTGVRVEGLTGTATATLGVGDPPAGRSLELSAPFPNPARAHASFAFSLTRAGEVRLRVCDLAGRVVRTLAERDYPAGRHEAAWDGRDADGSRAHAGVYLVELQSAEGRASRRIVWLP